MVKVVMSLGFMFNIERNAKTRAFDKYVLYFLHPHNIHFIATYIYIKLRGL